MNPHRALDLCLLLPVLPWVSLTVGGLALLVLAVDGGPAFFAQERVGQGGQTFRVWKLRTMTTEPDPAHRRPTRLGAWLRHRGLDELPQLFCVLSGDMGIVGPRPLTPADLERLVERHPPFAARLALRPGITGLAQACQTQGIEQTTQAEAAYARSASLTLDIRLIARTAWMNLVGKTRGRWPLAEALSELEVEDVDRACA
jgi:lipopolysaccharide/colanic/teichoic acid biosynthesis glycosyltransferase